MKKDTRCQYCSKCKNRIPYDPDLLSQHDICENCEEPKSITRFRIEVEHDGPCPVNEENIRMISTFIYGMFGARANVSVGWETGKKEV